MHYDHTREALRLYALCAPMANPNGWRPLMQCFSFTIIAHPPGRYCWSVDSWTCRAAYKSLSLWFWHLFLPLHCDRLQARCISLCQLLYILLELSRWMSIHVYMCMLACVLVCMLVDACTLIVYIYFYFAVDAALGVCQFHLANLTVQMHIYTYARMHWCMHVNTWMHAYWPFIDRYLWMCGSMGFYNPSNHLTLAISLFFSFHSIMV